MAFNPSPNLVPLRRFFDGHAPRWDAMISPAHATRLERLVQRLAPSPDARILDVGCGTGVLFPSLARRLDKRGCVVALDVSFAMMQETRKRAAAATHACMAVLLQADVIMPPLRGASFDWIICNSCFPHFHDQGTAMGVMSALLRPGGTLVVCHTESRDAINALHRNIGGVVGGHELPNDATFRALVRSAGLHLESLEDGEEGFLLVARKQD